MKQSVWGLFFIALVSSCASTVTQSEKAASFSFKEIEAGGTADLGSPVFITASDGIKLACYPYLSEKPIASLVFFHGGGAYSGAGYQNLAAGLARSYGVNVYLLDLRGHGHSQGPRGDSPSVDQVYKDVHLVISQVKKEDDSLPIFLGGHSSGAGLVLNYLSQVPDERIQGYIFLSPYFGYKSGTDKTTGQSENAGSSFTEVNISAFVLNGMTFGLLFGNSPAVVFNYSTEVLRSEPLLIPSITVNMSLATTPYDPQGQFKNLKKPYALFIGGEDELLNPAQVLAYAQLPSARVRSASLATAVEGAKHLSILLIADKLIGEAIGTLLRGSSM